MKLFVVIEGDNDWPEMQDPDRLLMAFTNRERAEYLRACMQIHSPLKEDMEWGDQSNDEDPRVYYYEIKEVYLAS
jgi:hypothetical protein